MFLILEANIAFTEGQRILTILAHARALKSPLVSCLSIKLEQAHAIQCNVMVVIRESIIKKRFLNVICI